MKAAVGLSTVQTGTVIVNQVGDGLAALRKLKQKYLNRAAYIAALGYDATFYLRAAQRVGLLIAA